MGWHQWDGVVRMLVFWLLLAATFYSAAGAFLYFRKAYSREVPLPDKVESDIKALISVSTNAQQGGAIGGKDSTRSGESSSPRSAEQSGRNWENQKWYPWLKPPRSSSSSGQQGGAIGGKDSTRSGESSSPRSAEQSGRNWENPKWYPWQEPP
jgi:hypothetical protein